MPNPQFANEDQDEIRNASERVVVVATRFALDEYSKYCAYIWQPHRSFQPCVRMAFYAKNKIDRRIPKILGHIEAISRDEIETRTDLTDSESKVKNAAQENSCSMENYSKGDAEVIP